MTDSDPTFVLRGGESWRNPFESYAALREHDPVHRVDHPAYGEFFVLTRFADVFAAVRDTETFSSAEGLTPDPQEALLFEENAAPIVMMDPPIHTAMRRLVSKPMTPRRVAPVEPAIAQFVDDRLDQIDDSAEVDIVELLFKPLPSMVVAHYLGVPEGDRSRFDGWTASIVAANAVGDFSDAADATGELFEYAAHLIEKRKVEPGADLVTDLVEAGEDKASVEWIVGFVFTMVAGGNDTTTGLLGGAAELLTLHRDQRQLLVDDPSLIRPAIDEFLRLTSPVQNLARTATRDVEVNGVTIPKGRKVLLVYGSANRDPDEFGPDADQLDVRRKIDKMLAFAYGPHHCLGAAAARLQGGVALERLLARFPDFEVDPSRGVFAPGSFVRRYESLPMRTGS